MVVIEGTIIISRKDKQIFSIPQLCKEITSGNPGADKAFVKGLFVKRTAEVAGEIRIGNFFCQGVHGEGLGA